MYCDTQEFVDFEEWEDCISRTFVPLHTRCSGESPQFSGGLTSAVLGSVVLADVSIASIRQPALCVVERTPRLIRQDDPELYKLGLQVSGTSVIEQDGRQAHLSPGDLTIYDTSRPNRISCSSDFRMTVAMFPRALVRLPAQQMAELTAVRLPGNDGLTSLIGSILSRLSAACNATSLAAGSHLGDAVIDLIAAVFAERIHQPQQQESLATHRVLVAQVSRYVDVDLHRPGSHENACGQAHFGLVCFLQKVFEAARRSVSSEFRKAYYPRGFVSQDTVADGVKASA
ncbi:MAG TPA: hypothetical protein VJ777_19025 [Mycobacterium sp.]|nr:hypothetical protein [Mycobacterium sp.]